MLVVGCGVEPRPAATKVDGGRPAPVVAPPVAAPAPPEPVAVASPASDGGAPFEIRERVAPQADATVVADAGAEPRAVLASRASVGDRRELGLRMGMAVAMALGDRDVPETAVPPLDVVLVVETTAVDAEGITQSVSVREVTTGDVADATPRVRDAMVRTADRLRSTKGTMRIARDGRVLAFELGDSAAAPAQGALEPELGGLAAALQELLPALPGEAVGDGARWTSVRHVRRDAVRLQQNGAWTLRREGAITTLSLRSEHVATSDPAPAGMVEASSGTTVAEIVLGDGPLPTRATATIDTNTRANLEVLGAAQRVAVRTVLTLELRDVDRP